jgi:serine/threonine protein kinase/streptogramin lyase
MELNPGSEFAGYRIESVLGRGGMGVVYLAEHIGMGRKVALKVLASDLAQDERFRERFVRESRLAASLEHPNIVPIHEAGEVGGVLFIAMRYVEGQDLQALLRANGALEPHRAASIVGQVASALDAAHARGLVHRDVKPGNVLIATAIGSAANEHVYLSDFGLTKRTSSDSGITGTGQFVGTLEYAAPEQFEGSSLDARTDVYSLGCVAYECLTGRPPFRRDSDAALMYAHLTERAPAPSSVRPELPAAIDPVVARAMAKKPADRYESAGAFATGVQQALPPADGSGVGGPTPGRRSLTLIAAGAALGVILVVVLIALSLGGGGTPDSGGPPSSPTAVGPPLGSVVEIDPSTGTIVSTVSGLDIDALSGFRAALAVGEGGVWVLDRSTVTHIDPGSGTIEKSIPYQGAGLTGYVRAIGVGLGDLVITDIGTSQGSVLGAISRIDPATNRIRTIELPSVGPPTGVAIGGGAIWETFGCLEAFPNGEQVCARPEGILLRLDPRTFEITGRFALGGTESLANAVDLGRGLGAVAADDNGVWVIDLGASRVRLVDPRTGEVSEPIEVSASDGLAADAGSVWVLDRDSGTVTQVDPVFGIGETIRVGDDPTDMAAGLGALWVCDGSGALWRVDLVTHEVTSIEIGSPLAAIAIDKPHGTVWALVHR